MDKVISPGDVSIRIVWDDPSLDDLMSVFYSPWDGGSGSIRYTILINRERDGYALAAPLENSLCADENDLLSRLEFNVTSLSQEILNGFLQIHAACVDYRGKGILLVGDHGIGKSTLALTAASFGMEILTDDVCVIDTRAGRVKAFPRPIKASDHTMMIISPDIQKKCHVRKVNHDTSFVFFYTPPSALYRAETRPEYIFFLKREKGTAAVAEMNEKETMQRLLRQGFNFTQRSSTFVAELLSLMRSTSRYELTYSDNFEAMHAILDTIQKTV